MTFTKKVYIVYSKSKDFKSVYEYKEDALDFIGKYLEERLYIDEINYFEKKKKSVSILSKIPTEISMNILKYLEEENCNQIKLTCKNFYNLIISIKQSNLNQYALSNAFNNKLSVECKNNIISIGNKTYEYKQIFKKYGGIWKSNTKEWIFKDPKIIFYLENKLKKTNLYELQKVNYYKYDEKIINIMKKFNLENLYQYYLHIIKRYKYNSNCKICMNNNTCDFCIQSCCKKMRYPKNPTEGYNFIYICIVHGNIRYKYQGD